MISKPSLRVIWREGLSDYLLDLQSVILRVSSSGLRVGRVPFLSGMVSFDLLANFLQLWAEIYSEPIHAINGCIW